MTIHQKRSLQRHASTKSVSALTDIQRLAELRTMTTQSNTRGGKNFSGSSSSLEFKRVDGALEIEHFWHPKPVILGILDPDTLKEIRCLYCFQPYYTDDKSELTEYCTPIVVPYET